MSRVKKHQWKRDQIQQSLEYWQMVLGLMHYEIMWHLHHKLYDDDDVDQMYTRAELQATPDRLSAHIFVSDLFFKDEYIRMDIKAEIHKTLGHEMVHLVFADNFKALVEETMSQIDDEGCRNNIIERFHDADERMTRMVSEALCAVQMG